MADWSYTEEIRTWRRDGWIYAAITLLLGVLLDVVGSIFINPIYGAYFLVPFVGVVGAYVGVLHFEKGFEE
jgi:hypothetical protein